MKRYKVRWKAEGHITLEVGDEDAAKNMVEEELSNLDCVGITRVEMEVAEDGLPICFACGHSHRHLASAWNSKQGQRFFCHENDHSCYNDQRGRYFEDTTQGGKQ